jgi:arginyl-tRNA synthetase
MVLGNRLGKNPREVAEKIAAWILEQVQNDSAIKIAGPGFINFTLSDAVLFELVRKNDFGRNDIYKNKSIVLDFSDPNPFKVLHIGHLYTSIVGESISRLFENAGGDVHRTNFGGDVGLHVAKNLFAMQKHMDEFQRLKGLPENDELDEKAEFMAKCYVEGTNDYEDNAKDEIDEINRQVYEINKDDLHDSELAKMYWTGRSWSYLYFDRFYAQIDIKFEKYYPESTVAGPGQKIVLEQLEKGVYQKSKESNAVIFNGEKYGLHTRVFINKNGIPTYESKDVGLIFTKWQDFHFDKSIVITGNEQLDYMKVVLKSIEQYAPDLVEKSTHITHGLVKLPGAEKMSSRKGNFVKAIDVMNEVSEIVANTYDNKDSEIINKVSLGAIKYAFLKYKIGGDNSFDVNESVSMQGNSGPYLQYAGARAKSILRKTNGSKSLTDANDFDENERKLAVKLIRFDEVVKQATQELAPHLICTYLYELASVFNRFYEASQVAGDPREAFRANLVEKYAKTLDAGLRLLGIPIVEKM